MIDTHNNRRLIPLTKWNDFHMFPPVGGLRHLVFNAQFNGFEKVIKRIGRRILIDEQAFFEWIDEGKPSGRSLPNAKPQKRRN